MEKGATWSSTSNGFSISDNKASSNSDVVGLMKLHSDDAEFPFKIWMDIHHPVDAGGGGGGGEPGGISSGGAHEAVVGHVHRDDDASSSCVGAENYARSSTGSQPFDIFASSYSTTTNYKSLGGGGGGMAASVAAFPFTSAQWKELERQALIYKYMISSVPVPPHLLFPLSRSFPAAPSLVYNVGYTKNGDLEPGRCKRTDGKKWRCSKEVAPGQKYCERHLHRGRPRSRKPVEVQTNAVENHHKKTRLHHQLHLPNSTTTTTTHAKSDPTISTSTSSYKAFNRDLGFMNREMVPLNGGFANEGSSIYSSAPIFHQDYYMDQLTLNTPSYSNSDFGAPTSYIDAWSTDNHLNSSSIINSTNNDDSEYSLSWMNNGDFSPSLDLSIAMAAGNFIDAEMGNVRMAAHDDEDNVSKDSNSRMSSPVFWEPFGRGGPLAEALQAASPRDSISTPATTVSSPSGVLHSNRTLFSHSDGSVCNSPTFAVPTSEAAFQRLN